MLDRAHTSILESKIMTYAPRGLCPASRIFAGTLLGIFSFLISVSPAFSARWDREAAQKALIEARKMREELGRATNPSKDRYLSLIRKYKLVYASDPHYSGSDDAIYEAGEVYQEMGEKFGTLLYYKEAAKMYQFLLRDYNTSPRCPEALLRLGDLYSGPLEDESAAQAAYNRLRKEYRNSKAAEALTLKASRETPKESDKDESQRNQPAPSGPAENGVARHAIVENIRHWTTTDYTRIIIDLDTQTRYTKTRLSNPDRIYFDISNASLGKELSNKTFAVSDEFLRQVRVAQNRADVVRVVLDFAAISDYSVFELHDPFRIVVDIHGTRGDKSKADLAAKAAETSEEAPSKPIPIRPLPASSSETKGGEKPPASSAATHSGGSPVSSGTKTREDKSPLKVEELAANSPKPADIAGRSVTPPPVRAAAPRPPEAKPAAKTRASAPDVPPLPKTADVTSRGDRTLTRVLGLKIGRIVIDPGHGGHDTGTIGRGGLAEKDLVLQVARDLKRLLEDKIGAQVILTRSDDRFVSLEERTAIANQARADLFISIHANSSSSRSTSGVETYYLDFARSESERAVAARENASTVRNVRDLQSLIKKIAQADKSAESRELAAILQKKLYGGARTLFPAAKNRGVRSAPFVVLIGANMPSVLAEVAFISNPRDEKLLKQESNRAQLARALFAGIEGYMKTLGSEVARNRQDGD